MAHPEQWLIGYYGSLLATPEGNTHEKLRRRPPHGSAALTLPDAVADDLVAALGLSAIAAWMALTWRGQLQQREQVLVLGASSAVGQVAVQAARILVAGRVIAASRARRSKSPNLPPRRPTKIRPHWKGGIQEDSVRLGGDGRIRTADKGFADPRLNHLATSPD